MPAIELDHQVMTYLRRPHLTFWQWEFGDDVITWTHGGTLAYRAELHTAMQRLAPRGLPPLGALLLVVAAMRKSWLGDDSPRTCVANLVSELAGHELYVPEQMLAEVLVGLDALSQSCQALEGDRAAIAEAPELLLGDGDDRTTPELAARVVRFMEHAAGDAAPRLDTREQSPARHRASFDQLLRELRALHEGLHRADAESLSTRARTGLDTVVQLAPVDDDELRSPRSLIEVLQHDEQLRGLGQLARDLLAAIHIPRRLDRKQDLPIGGVSDITNRGPLDRLLVSELAQDDMTLAVRVAMNEALYLRREDPPALPTLRREVLIDVGIRQWGVPRLFAAAVGLALAAMSDKHITVSASSAKGDALIDIDFTTRDGLVDLLSRLSVDRHPGKAVRTLLERGNDDACERVIITHASTVKDRAFRAALAECDATDLYVCSVDRDGAFELWARRKDGFVSLSRATLNLADIIPGEDQRSQVFDADVDASLPAILRVRPFPLYMPDHCVLERAWSVPQRSTFVVTKDARLLAFPNPKRGGSQLMDDAPQGHVLCANIHDTSHARAIIGNLSRAEYLSINLDTFAVFRVLLEKADAEPIMSAFMINLMPVLVYARKLVLLSPSDGSIVTELRKTPNDRHFDGRYLVDERGDWSFVQWNGGPSLERIAIPSEPKQKYLVMFDARGIDGPIGFATDGTLCFLDDRYRNTTLVDKGPFHWAAVSRDGRRIRARGLRLAGTFSIEDNRGVRWTDGLHDHLFEPRTTQQVNDRSMRKHLQGAAIAPDGQLLLLAPKGRVLQLTHDAQHMRLVHVRLDHMRKTPTFQTFKPIQLTGGQGYKLTAASLGGGGRIVLDSRGLIHLQPGDANLHEVTLTFCDVVSGWCSDGTLWGDPFFVGDGPRAGAPEVYKRLISPILTDMQ